MYYVYNMHTLRCHTYVTLNVKILLFVPQQPFWLLGQYGRLTAHTICTNMSSKTYMQIKCYIIHVKYQNQLLKQKEKHCTEMHCFSILTADSNTMTMLLGSDKSAQRAAHSTTLELITGSGPDR